MNRSSIITSLILFACVAVASAQDSTGISYQALVQSEVGSTSNTTIGVRLSILQDSATGPAVYTERQTPMSNQYGMITLEIGTGTAESGTFGGIDWSTGRYFIKSEIDPAGGTNYSITGTYEQLSVPYAFYAREAASAPKAGKAASVNIRGSESGDTLFIGNSGAFVIIPGIIFPPKLRDGYVPCDSDNPMVISTVTSDSTGKVWMDRNLGASRVATASDDSLAYGDLYQWGRFADGHQCQESETTSQLATSSAVNSGDAWYGKFILSNSSPQDWLSVQDSSLWQGVDGANNPCPEGFRLPTAAEWDAERQTWDFNRIDGALASPLKLSAPGNRSNNTGLVGSAGERARYWSSSVSGSNATHLYISVTYAGLENGYYRSYGFSVRCIKD